jgi:hypothetical protein
MGETVGVNHLRLIRPIQPPPAGTAGALVGSTRSALDRQSVLCGRPPHELPERLSGRIGGFEAESSLGEHRLRASGPSYARSRQSPALPLTHGLLRRRVGGRTGILLAHGERQDDYRKGSPTDCPEPVRSTGRTILGKKRMWLWSCHGMSMALRTSALCPGTSSSRPS